MFIRKLPIIAWASLLACFTFSVSSHAGEGKIEVDKKYRHFFKSYCVECHNEKKTKGKTRLDEKEFSFAIKTVKDADHWQDILEAINAGEMPPEDEVQPKTKEKLEFLEMLSDVLVEAREVLSDSGGKVVMRRLNRREYQNSIEHILGIKVDVSELPSDQSEHFDTDGASLFMSAYQIEQYLQLGREVLNRAMADRHEGEKFKSRIEPEESVNKFVQTKVDGYKKKYDAAKAYESSKELKKDPKAFGLIDERDVTIANSFYDRFYGTYDYYVKHPLAETGVLLSLWHPKPMEMFKIQSYKKKVALKPNKNGQPRSKNVMTLYPNGLYKIRARVAKTAQATSERSFLDFGVRQKDGGFVRSNTFHMTASTDEPQIVETMVELTSENRQFAFREKSDDGTARYRYTTSHKKTGHGAEFALWMDWIEFEGPFPREKKAMEKRLFKIFKSDSDVVESDVKSLIRGFAELAFRGAPRQPAYLEHLYGIYEKELKNGKKAEEAIVEPLAIILASPAFLYLSEPMEKETSQLLSQRELAIRLSYFLWSSPPDNVLLSLAQAGKLKGATLNQQVNRLLASPKAENFYRSFAYQWLDMERLSLFQFNVAKYTKFDDTLKSAAAEEVYQTLKVIVDENLSSETLLDSDFVMVNALLAEHYGLKNVEGDSFRKVKLPKNSIRGGLTSMAAILAMGSDGEETSPVERGAWVLRKILNNPPPPAPANVPQLSRIDDKKLSVKEKLKIHQEEPQCAHCHKRIDPLGFGLENFDAMGLWRTEEKLHKKKVKIETAGQLYKGESFKSYRDLKDIFVSKLDHFDHGLIEHMLSYSLGRPVGFSDQGLIEELQLKMKKTNHKIRPLIQGIVQSKFFRSKK